MPKRKMKPDVQNIERTVMANNAAYEIFNHYVSQINNNFNNSYKSTCLSVGGLEHFTVSYNNPEFHYTLYYYNQAGNLVKTIPPGGVSADFSQLYYDAVKAYRNNPGLTRPQSPGHRLATSYRYNSLNEVVEQYSPDGGLSRFYYDKLGRVTLSQNGKQSLTDSYSYTIYDGLGRIEEVGETVIGGGITQSITQMAEDPSTLVPPERTEITHTGYDAAYISDGHFAPLFRPGYLRGRVSYSWVKDSYNDVNYRMGTFYSYDAHGNVKTLFHDYHEGVMEDAGNAFKRMDYEYDLISGKVKEVRYQDGEADAFYHRYGYDGENRLKTVETSRDKIWWQRDAKYGYYKHGPVARLELGELQVQGVDYAYTLQGWLKGINSTGVGDGAFDMGGDGKTGTANALFAKDVYGMSLNYYNKTELGKTRVDYSPINASGLGTNTPFLAGGVTELTASSNAVATSLFNGNIASMFVNIRKLTTGTNNAPDALLYAYRYDQLNRLKKMQVFEGFDDATNSWATQAATDDYKEAVDYDANGNITHYKRNGRNSVHGLNMDDLSYHYKTNNNQLRSVSDGAGGSYTDDIKDQVSADNYVYDEIGNLTKDESEGITEVKWTVYGKVGSIWKACSGCGSEGYKAVEYTYDGMGNRISKTYKSAPDASPKTTWYVRDASGNVMSVYEKEQGRSGGDLVQSEVDVYGSGRLGIYEPDQVVEGMQLETGYHSFTRRKKLYELSNQLGNVLATVTDRAVPVSDNQTPANVSGYVADVVNANDYYPGGMLLPGRTFSTGNYRYGFNGKEMDNEVKGTGAQYDYGFRIYDPRVVRFLSVDPLFQTYPWYTPYQFAGNMPIWAIDLDGLEEMKANSVANVIKDINGNIITKPTVINDQSSSANIIPGVRRLNANQIEVTPGLIGEKHPYWNTFTWQQVNGKDFYCNQSITPIGQEAGGTVKPPKTNLQQDNDDVPPPTGIGKTTITPINESQVQNQTLTRNINFVSGEPQFATDADRQMVNQVANQAPNSTTTGRPRTTTAGNTTTTTTTTRQVRSIITIDLKTDLEEHDYSRNLQTNRYNLIRQQLINSGVPARNIRRGRTQYNQTDESMGGRTNQTIFRVRTTRSRTKTGTTTTTE